VVLEKREEKLINKWDSTDLSAWQEERKNKRTYKQDRWRSKRLTLCQNQEK